MLDRRALGQIAQVLHSSGNALNTGRALPPQVRTAIGGLAGVLRDILDPRTGMAARDTSTSQALRDQ
jgi:hypothetical protein